MQIVLKDGHVVATHDAAQEIAIATHYPTADEIAQVPDGLSVMPGDADPRPGIAPVDLAKAELQGLDLVLPRIAEDMIDALAINESSLPQIVQDRLAAKRAARAIVRGE